MADVRDMILAGQPGARPMWAGHWRRFLQRLTMTVRYMVVATSVPPIREIYRAIYRLHVWYAVRVLRKFPQVTSVYLARGAASKEAVPGVSDIDLLVIGEWTEAENRPLMEAVQRLIRRSPLYDSTIATSVNTLETVRALHAGDYFFQFRFDRARRQSQLLYGSDVLATLPDIPGDRVRGCYYVETKLWWMLYMTAAFGSGVTASDTIFRNSIAFKTVAEILHMEAALDGKPVEASRNLLLERAAADSTEPDRAIIERLASSQKQRFLGYRGEVLNDLPSIASSDGANS